MGFVVKLAKNFLGRGPGMEVDGMKDEIWKFDGIWNGDRYRNWFDSEVEE